MDCPRCGGKTKVRGTRKPYRYRGCFDCNKHFYTEEIISDGSHAGYLYCNRISYHSDLNKEQDDVLQQ